MKNTTQTESEIVARRVSFDGVTIFLHADGTVSTRTHFIGRTGFPVAQMWRAIDEVAVYTHAELPAFIRSVRSGEWQAGRERAAQAARNRAVPEARRLYVTRDLANGATSYVRVR